MTFEERMEGIRGVAKKSVFCTLTFEGFHQWPEAPEACAHLRNLHRHVFHVKVEFKVQGDRQIEFISMKSKIEDWIAYLKSGGEFQAGERVDLVDLETWSCETWALVILTRYSSVGAVMVEVSEDGENGAAVYL